MRRREVGCELYTALRSARVLGLALPDDVSYQLSGDAYGLGNLGVRPGLLTLMEAAYKRVTPVPVNLSRSYRFKGQAVRFTCRYGTRVHQPKSPLLNPEIMDGVSASKPATSSILRSRGSAIVNWAAVMPTTISRASMPVA